MGDGGAGTCPENCPEPSWHETHHYCPRCTWTNPDAPKSTDAMRLGTAAEGDPFVEVIAKAIRGPKGTPIGSPKQIGRDALDALAAAGYHVIQDSELEQRYQDGWNDGLVSGKAPVEGHWLVQEGQAVVDGRVYEVCEHLTVTDKKIDYPPMPEDGQAKRVSAYWLRPLTDEGEK